MNIENDLGFDQHLEVSLNLGVQHVNRLSNKLARLDLNGGQNRHATSTDCLR